MLRHVLDAKSKVAAAESAISFIDAHAGTSAYACNAKDHHPPLILYGGRLVSLQPQLPACTDDVLQIFKRELSKNGDHDAVSKLEVVQLSIHSANEARLLSSSLPFTSSLPSSVAPFADGQVVDALRIDMDVDAVHGLVSGQLAAELLCPGNGARLLSDLPPPMKGSLTQTPHFLKNKFD